MITWFIDYSFFSKLSSFHCIYITSKRLQAITISVLFPLKFDSKWKLFVIACFEIMDHTLAGIERINVFDFIVSQLEIENVDVFFDSFWCDGFWDRNGSNVNLF